MYLTKIKPNMDGTTSSLDSGTVKHLKQLIDRQLRQSDVYTQIRQLVAEYVDKDSSERDQCHSESHVSPSIAILMTAFHMILESFDIIYICVYDDAIGASCIEGERYH